MLKFACVLLFVAAASAGTISYEDCRDAGEAPIGTDFVLTAEGFPDFTNEVTLKKGETYTLGMSFKAGSASSTLTNAVFGEIAGIPVSWGDINANACDNLSSTTPCPLVAGRNNIYTNTLFVDPSYPSISLTIIWKLVDANNKNQVCFRLPARIVN